MLSKLEPKNLPFKLKFQKGQYNFILTKTNKMLQVQRQTDCFGFDRLFQKKFF